MTSQIDLGIQGLEGAEEIGRGGFGVVYRAHQPRFGRTVAVKVLSVTQIDDAARARFDRECQAAGALSGHPNIVTVFDSGMTEGNQPYLVMEYLSGGSFAERVRNEGPVGWEQVVDGGVQMAGALETAHGAGVLHRDVKPENILIGQFGEPKLVDFGIATVRGGYETRSGAITTSIAYAAPEIVGGQRASASSDVYSLASTLFFLLAGQAAFTRPEDETLVPLLARIASATVPDLRPQGVPGPVCGVIERAMAKEATDRYPSASAFGVALRAAGVEAGASPADMVVTAVTLPPFLIPPTGGEDALLRNETVTVGRRREKAAPAPLVLAAPWWKGRRALIGAAVVLVLLATGAGASVLGGGDDDPTTTTTTTPGGPTSETTGGPTSETMGESSSETTGGTSGTTGGPTPTTARRSTVTTKPGSTVTTQPGATVTTQPGSTITTQPGSTVTTTPPFGGGGDPVTTTTLAVAPSAPASFATSNPQSAGASGAEVALSLAWQPPTNDGGSSIQHYKIYRTDMKGASTATTSPVVVATVTGTFTSLTTGRSNLGDSWVKWEIAAVNAAGLEGPRQPARVNVPDVRGEDSTEATHRLRVAGLRVQYWPPGSCAADTVCNQDPSSGQVANGTIVRLTNSG